jgi:uncharacterized protein DUF3592
MNDRAERRRQLRDELRAMTPEQKRQFLREFLRWAFAAFGVRVASADEITWRRIFGPHGCLGALFSLAVLVTAIVLMGRNDGSSGVFFAVLVAGGLAWGGIKLLRRFARHAWRKAAGYTGTATVVDHEIVDDAGVARFTALVDLTTRSGEVRRRLPLERRPLPGLIDPVVGRGSRFESDAVDPAAEPEPLPIGMRLAVVYDPRDPEAIERASFWTDAGRLIGGICALALAALIAAQLATYALTGRWLISGL